MQLTTLLVWLLGFVVVVVRGLPPAGTGDKLNTLKLFTSPGLNGTVHVDDDGFLQLPDGAGEDAIHDVVKYYVVATIGTGLGQGMYSLAIDTTRSATWMQCVPCSSSNTSSCFPQEPPPFDPSHSPTFDPHPLATFCSSVPDSAGEKTSCEFHTSRPDGMAANGFLVQDNFIVVAANGNSSFSFGFPFGCVHNSVGFQSHGVMAGVLSLGKSRVSFAGMKGVYRFSYCLAPPTGQPQEHYGFLRLNNNVPDTAHMQRIKFHDASPGNNNSYFVNLVGVSLAGARLPGISRETFQRTTGGAGGTVINPGVSTTIMVRDAYDSLEHALEDHLRAAGFRRVVRRSGYHLCLNGSTHTVQADMPSVTLHLDDDSPGVVDMELSPQQLFVGASSEVTCLAVVPGSMTVIGALQQMNRRFTYDLTEDTILHAGELRPRRLALIN